MLRKKQGPDDPRWPSKKQDRNELICNLFKQGVPMTKIGEDYNLSRQRVQQILKRYNLGAEDGGKYVTELKQRPQKLKEQRERERIAKEKKRLRRLRQFGCSEELWQKLRATHSDYYHSAVGRYQRLKFNCHSRGIPFLLTLGQWWRKWNSSGKYNLYGQNSGMYVLGRKDLKGPFSATNCVVRKANDNSAYARYFDYS